jgi:hypothetical protein
MLKGITRGEDKSPQPVDSMTIVADSWIDDTSPFCHELFFFRV